MLNAGFFDEQGVTCKMLNDMFGTILTNGGLSNKHPGTDEEAGDVFWCFFTNLECRLHAGHAILEGRWVKATRYEANPTGCFANATGMLKPTGDTKIIFYFVLDKNNRDIHFTCDDVDNLGWNPELPSRELNGVLPIAWGKAHAGATTFYETGRYRDFVPFLARIKSGLGTTPIRKDKMAYLEGDLKIEGNLEVINGGWSTIHTEQNISGKLLLKKNSSADWGGYGPTLPATHVEKTRLYFKEV